MGFSIDDFRLTMGVISKAPRQRMGVSVKCPRPRILKNRQSSITNRQLRSGFTLLETALAVVIVGVGVLAIVSAQQAFHRQNAWSSHAGIAAYLGNEIREMTLSLPRHDPVTGTAYWGPEPNEVWPEYNDLDDFDGEGAGIIFSAALGNGPINAQRTVIQNMTGWAQIVTVANVDPQDITAVRANGTTNAIRVQVVVTYQGPNDTEPQEVTRVSWVSPN